jgi:hypothetical protein
MYFYRILNSYQSRYNQDRYLDIHSPVFVSSIIVYLMLASAALKVSNLSKYNLILLLDKLYLGLHVQLDFCDSHLSVYAHC